MSAAKTPDTAASGKPKPRGRGGVGKVRLHPKEGVLKAPVVNGKKAPEVPREGLAVGSIAPPNNPSTLDALRAAMAGSRKAQNRAKREEAKRQAENPDGPSDAVDPSAEGVLPAQVYAFPNRGVPPGPNLTTPPKTPEAVTAAIQRMSAVGITPAQIGYILDMSEAQVLEEYREAILLGKAKADFNVASTIFNVATDKNHPKWHNAALFWAERQMGWKVGTALKPRRDPMDLTPEAAAEGVEDEVELDDADVAARLAALGGLVRK